MNQISCFYTDRMRKKDHNIPDECGILYIYASIFM